MYPLVAAYSMVCYKSSQKVFYFICRTVVEVDTEKEHQERIFKEYQSKLKYKVE